MASMTTKEIRDENATLKTRIARLEERLRAALIQRNRSSKGMHALLEAKIADGNPGRSIEERNAQWDSAWDLAVAGCAWDLDEDPPTEEELAGAVL